MTTRQAATHGADFQYQGHIMTLLDAILDFGRNHNLQVFGEFLCLFDSDDREHVKYVKFELDHLAEILAIQHTFKSHPMKGWAYEQIVNRRVEKWEYVVSPAKHPEPA